LLVFLLFVVILLVSPPLLAYVYTPPKGMVISPRANKGGFSGPYMSTGGYGILVWLAVMPCAAVGGIFGMAFRITLHVKDIERGGSTGPRHAWGKSQPGVWLKAGQYSMLGALVFGGWTALWLWPVVR
jgi:hypothetical protein